jgi:hypothetical protein
MARYYIVNKNPVAHLLTDTCGFQQYPMLYLWRAVEMSFRGKNARIYIRLKPHWIDLKICIT